MRGFALIFVQRIYANTYVTVCKKGTLLATAVSLALCYLCAEYYYPNAIIALARYCNSIISLIQRWHNGHGKRVN